MRAERLRYARCTRDVFQRLYEYKMREGIPTWEEALERLLAAAHQETILQ